MQWKHTPSGKTERDGCVRGSKGRPQELEEYGGVVDSMKQRSIDAVSVKLRQSAVVEMAQHVWT